MKRFPSLVPLFFCLSAFAQGADTRLLPADPSELLGMTPASIIEEFGAPIRVFALRGEEPWQDDVVFDYGTFSVFLCMDRVWQLRLPPDYPKPVWGFQPGSGEERISASLGLPAQRDASFAEWSLHGRGWPVRLRVIFGPDGKAEELYVYRSDF